MDPHHGDWPAARWRLTAPESYVLQIPKPLSAVEAFKLALRELVLRRALRLEQLEIAGLFARRRSKAVLMTGSQHPSTFEPALAPLLELHARLPATRGLDGVLVEDFAKAARREFTRSFAGYVNDCVYPALAERGLMRLEETRRLGVRRRRHVLTEAGHEAAAELDEWLLVGHERLPDWARETPERALAYAGGAGAAILLMPSLYPDFHRLGQRVLMDGGPVAGDGWAGVEGFDGLDGGFDGLDAGIDAGAGWGGDGGGGDGGGGGGGDGGGG